MPPSALLNAERPTPELALVDTQLAVAARSALPEVDTLAQIELLVRAHRIAASRSAARAEPPAAPPASAPARVAPPAVPVPALAPARRRPRVGRRRSGLLALALAVAALVSTLLVGVRVHLGGPRTGADASLTERPPVVHSKPSPAKGSSVATSRHVRAKARPRHVPVKARRRRSLPHAPPKPRIATQPRRFVWAPVPGATAYRVEFFRGSKLVFDATTKKPEVAVPQRWTFAGGRHSLTPGVYRWNVWPITAAGQDSRAAVQARLVVSP